MYSVFLSSYRDTRGSLGELEKAVETLPCGSCSHSIWFLVLPNFHSCFYLTNRLWAGDFYRVIVDEGANSELFANFSENTTLNWRSKAVLQSACYKREICAIDIRSFFFPWCLQSANWGISVQSLKQSCTRIQTNGGMRWKARDHALSSRR